MLAHDPKYGRKLSIAYPPGRKISPGEPEAGDYPIHCKFVWLSNINPDTVFNDAAGAMKSRYTSVMYNFTDEEVMALIANKFEALYPEFDEVITVEDKARIFNIFWKFALKRKAQGILRSPGDVSFRNYNDMLETWWYYKTQGRSFDKFFSDVLVHNLKVTRH